MLLAQLRSIQTASSIVGDVRGKGLMIGIELVDNKVRIVRVTYGRPLPSGAGDSTGGDGGVHDVGA